MSRNTLTPLHHFHLELLEVYGPQGWWPLLGHEGCNPTKTGSVTGYHPGDYTFPHDEAERFEICAGAILTQNTAWPNVEKALTALAASGALEPEAILHLPDPELAALIRPSGYHNTKARKLKELAAFFRDLRGRTPTRNGLLAVWGIGPETADSILLYAYGEPEMVVDAYTRRVLERLGWVVEATSYEALKHFCAENLPEETTVYQEFHALVVEHAKRARAARADDWRKAIVART